MKRWYSPSWNGDFRLEASGSFTDESDFVITKPTEAEKVIITSFMNVCLEKKWLDGGKLMMSEESPSWLNKLRGRKLIKIKASVAEAGAELVKLAKPKTATLTAVRFSGGELAVAEQAQVEEHAELVTTGAKDAKAEAVTVKRATPSCPRCIPGSVEMASEVLQAFMTDEQHRDWSRFRVLEVEGGVTGHRYLLAHRHSEQARRWGRICFDADDEGVLHFHGNEHPPEEEVLSAMLILQHREAWLRNEATLLVPPFNAGGPPNGWTQELKNPFGGWDDGILDARLTAVVGEHARWWPAYAEGFKGVLPELLSE
jgi:hypothetical protein